jgi:hypothetical protein
MKENSKFELQGDVRFRVVADEGVIIRQTEGEVLIVNELGGEILTLIQQNLNLGDIVSTLSEHYDAEATNIMQDTQAYLKELLSGQVITMVEV